MELTERNIIEPFIGKTINRDNLARCANKNRETPEGVEHIVYSCGFLYKKDLLERFEVTDALKEKWEHDGVEFNVHVFLDGDVITKAFVDKYRESGACARPVVRALKFTQQELRVARRIMQYICN